MVPEMRVRISYFFFLTTISSLFPESHHVNGKTLEILHLFLQNQILNPKIVCISSSSSVRRHFFTPSAPSLIFFSICNLSSVQFFTIFTLSAWVNQYCTSIMMEERNEGKEFFHFLLLFFLAPSFNFHSCFPKLPFTVHHVKNIFLSFFPRPHHLRCSRDLRWDQKELKGRVEMVWWLLQEDETRRCDQNLKTILNGMVIPQPEKNKKKGADPGDGPETNSSSSLIASLHNFHLPPRNLSSFFLFLLQQQEKCRIQNRGIIYPLCVFQAYDSWTWTEKEGRERIPLWVQESVLKQERIGERYKLLLTWTERTNGTSWRLNFRQKF